MLTFEDRTDLPDGDGTETGELTEGDLEEEEGHPDEDEAREVGDEEDGCRRRQVGTVALYQSDCNIQLP